jgi:hypothetical protein
MREEKPCYLPEVWGYFMSEGEQREVYWGLKNRKKEIMNEMAAIDINLKAAGVFFCASKQVAYGVPSGELRLEPLSKAHIWVARHGQEVRGTKIGACQC